MDPRLEHVLERCPDDPFGSLSASAIFGLWCFGFDESVVIY